MRYLYAVICGMLVQPAYAQVAADSVLSDSAHYQVVRDERWVRSQVDSLGECTEVLHMSGQGGLVRVFHASGRLKEYIPYADLQAGRVHGLATTWYDSGQLAAQQVFLKGQREGELILYYDTGQLKRQTHYEAGAELPGNCFAPSGAPLPYFPYEQPPLYPGGQTQLLKDINRLLRHQSLGFLLTSMAQVHISFQVSENGSIERPQVEMTNQKLTMSQAPRLGVQYISQMTISESIALLSSEVQQALAKLDKRFLPGKRDGVAARWQYSFFLPLTF